MHAFWICRQGSSDLGVADCAYNGPANAAATTQNMAFELHLSRILVAPRLKRASSGRRSRSVNATNILRGICCRYTTARYVDSDEIRPFDRNAVEPAVAGQ